MFYRSKFNLSMSHAVTCRLLYFSVPPIGLLNYDYLLSSFSQPKRTMSHCPLPFADQRMLRGSSSLSYLDWVRCLVRPFLLCLPSHSASSMPFSWAQPLGLPLSSVPGGPFSCSSPPRWASSTSSPFSPRDPSLCKYCAPVSWNSSPARKPLSITYPQSRASPSAPSLSSLFYPVELLDYTLWQRALPSVWQLLRPTGSGVTWSYIFGAADSWHGSLAATTLIGFVGPVSAIGAILSSIDYSGLDHVMVFACGGLIPCFVTIMQRAARLDTRKFDDRHWICNHLFDMHQAGVLAYSLLQLRSWGRGMVRPRTELGVYKRVSRIVSRTREWLCRIFPYR